ncbi:S8 family serine peptidase [Aliikangiella coralliicola]|uniref:S8 family serine peptidase n=1 Tax=Aliikangiella coralliicola TaxID=2592383 RepID=A0A545UIX4_9GAMM|nr:S8 family serine peptidase [Aliikangiella coralliicola]TQV89409.1 S8 family serine peptidase [Aliikangiella coralliicola]
MKYPLKKAAIAVTTSMLGIAISTSANAIGTEQLSVYMDPESGLGGQNAITNQQVDGATKRYILKYKKTSANTLTKGSGQQMFNGNAARSRLLNHGANVKFELPRQHAVVAELTQQQLTEIAKDPDFLSFEVDQPRRLMAEYSDDAGDPTLTQLTPYSIYQSQANQLTLQPGMKVCVIDSGLAGKKGVAGDKNNDFDWSVITGSDDPEGTGDWDADGGPHGTHVAGTVGAVDNDFGVVGMAPGVPMHIVKVFKNGWAYSSDLAHAAGECIDAGANIITMSLGGGASNATEENAFKTFTENGGLVLAAAGNDGNTDRSFPAGYKSIMMVGGNDADNNIYTSSQHPNCTIDGETDDGYCVEVTAGGVDVLSTYPAGGTTVASLLIDGDGAVAAAMDNKGEVSGSTFFMGTAESTNSAANGKICVIDRGNITFHDKVKNCQDSGGVGAVIINNEAGVLRGTLGDSNATSIPAVGAALENRAAIIAATNLNISIKSGDYGYMSGTSMATPGVAGVAALVWSNHPSCTGTQIRNALKATAFDAGDAGKDDKFGYGIVKAKDASDYITANGCDGTGNGGGGNNDSVLTNRVSVTASGAKGSETRFTLEVPAGATDLKFAITGTGGNSSGDADLYVKFGSAPTTAIGDYDCRPWVGGNEETCLVSNAQEGTYHVMLHGYGDFANVSLTGSYTEGGSGGGAASFENANNFFIPDSNSTGITSSIVSTRSGASNTVTVDVDIIHTYIGDLTVDLIHPDGTVYNLHNRTDGSADNIIRRYSVDVGSKDSAGTWKLRARDSVSSDTGYIDRWKISFQ